MPITPAKNLSPADLAKLEHAFATDPASDAYRALAEAYLSMGRFMEAMVVCKKGVKAHPNSVEPRLLLARVYANQGKDKKALEELTGALAVAPEDKQVLRMAGSLQIKNGEAEVGKSNLLKAYQQDPGDSETQTLLSQHGIVASHAPQRSKPSFPPAGPQNRPAATVNGSAGKGAAGMPPRLEPTPPRAGTPHAQRPVNGAQAGMPLDARLQSTAPRHVGGTPEVGEDLEHLVAQKSRSWSIFVRLAAAMVFVLVAYFFIGQVLARRKNEVNRELSIAREALRHDNWDSYKKASEAATRALEVNSDSVEAHGMLAYAYAIRWGEHGGGDSDRQLAESHLAAAVKGGEVSSQLYAARALVQMYSGKREQALHDLQDTIDRFKAEGKQSSQLYLTLGLVQMRSGDYTHALDSLQRAQELASGDARVYAALGNLYRRTGQDAPAWKNYEFALQYEKDHPDSLLGKSILIASQDHSDAYPAAALMLKKLLDTYPPPSPRQLATAHLTRTLLISRAALSVPYSSADRQKELTHAGLPIDKAKAEAEALKEEDLGFGLDRGNPELHVIKGQRLLGENNIEGAVAEIRQALSMDKNSIQFYLELASALMKKPGGDKEAKDALLEGIRVVGQSPKLMVTLGNLQRKTGDLDGALGQYQRVLSNGTVRNAEARIGIGAIHRERKEWDKAEEAFQAALRDAVGQTSLAAAAKVELGQLYEAKGDRSKAEEAFKTALNADRNYTPAYYFYARLLASRDYGKARTTAQEYLRRAPRGEYAAEAQKMLER